MYLFHDTSRGCLDLFHRIMENGERVCTALLRQESFHLNEPGSLSHDKVDVDDLEMPGKPVDIHGAPVVDR